MTKERPYSFIGKRTECPNCKRKRTFAAFKEHPGFGYCFGCNMVSFPNGKRSSLSSHREEQKVADRIVNFDEVAKTFLWKELQPITERECNAFDERAAIMEFDGDVTRDEADDLSGYNKSVRFQDEITSLRLLNPFAATITILTRPTMIRDWNIGFTCSKQAIFWYQSVEGKFVNAKRVQFLEDGFHRNKDCPTGFLYSSNNGFSTCLFGENQLHPGFRNHLGNSYRPKTPVILVESEKTAIILSHHKPEFIWLAASGANGLTARKARVLQGRNVKVLYDCDRAGEDGSIKACEILMSIGAKAEKINQWKLTENPPDGFDIADLIYQQFIMKEPIA